MRLLTGHWHGGRAATGIPALARKQRAFSSLDALLIRQGGQRILYGSALAATIQIWSTDTDTPVATLAAPPGADHHTQLLFAITWSRVATITGIPRAPNGPPAPTG